jgi:Abnormal spindle-like microcephaly-assoc'd, ASPM-SPD-2-Hydin/PQQ-like domain
MRGMRKVWQLIVAAAVVTSVAAPITADGPARADEVTISQDQLRTGWDQNEPNLSPATLKGGTFGQLFATSVAGQVYAQPIVVTPPAGGQSVIVATEQDNVYSLNPETGAINWQLNLGPYWPSSVVGCGDLTPDIGVTSAPVYDPASGTVYLTAVVNDGPSLYEPHTYLVAINAQTGQRDWQVPVQGAPVNDPSRPFDPLTERQRAGLLLMPNSDGTASVYMAFASYCDYAPYVGYVAGVNTSTHALTLWSAEAGLTDNQGGIWLGGGGLMSDGSGRIFVTTGNGVSPAAGAGTNPPSELGDSVVRLGVQADGSLAAQDFFSPANAPALDAADRDFGSGGPVALPFGTSTYSHLLVQAGKDGRVFLLNRDGLGGRGATTDKPVSVSGPYAGQWGHPAAFAGTGGNDYVYYVGSNDYLRALKFNASTASKPVFTSAGTSPATFPYGSGSPVVTSNVPVNGAADPASAVVWEIERNGAASVLDAFAAVPASGKLTLLWSAPIGTAAKFSVPATDSGRVYVGTLDGKVYGFGSPDRTPLTGSAATFGQVAVGASQPPTKTVTVTAKNTVTVTGVSTTSTAATNPFTTGTPNGPAGAVTFPVTLTAGQTLSVPVTFNPTAPGGVTGSLDFATDTPNFSTVSVSLSGTGTQTGFYATPASVPFGTVPIGSSGTQQAVISNGGTAAEMWTTLAPADAAFTISGQPAAGTAIAAGQSVTLNITYQPTGTAGDTETLTEPSSLGGTPATVSVTGTGEPGQGTLTASPTSVDFGSVSLGQQASQSVDVTNTGNLPMTITGFTAPTVPFGTPAPVTTGITLDPGYDVVLPVTFTPQSQSTTSGSYTITANDGHNTAQTLTIGVSGTGVAASSGVSVPSPGGGWTLNGSARMTGTTLRLTTAAKSEAGSAVYYQPLAASDGVHAHFTTHIGGGNGADGMTFSLLDAATAKVSSLGGSGRSLGFGGLPGVAVTLDTYPNSIGIATGSNSSGLIMAATSTSVPNLRSGAHTVDIAVSGSPSVVTVSVDGKQYLSAQVSVPANMLAAFTGGTGGLYDNHDVSGVSVSSGSTVVPPPGGGWSYNGSAAMSGSDTRLTQAANGQDGSVVYPVPVLTNGLQVSYNQQIGGGTGADGMTFALLNPSDSATTEGSGGSAMGFGNLSGVAVAFDTHKVTGYPSSNFAGIATGTVSAGVLKFAQKAGQIGPLRTGTHNVNITVARSVAGTVLTVYFDGAQILQSTVSISQEALLAFTGATGGLNDVHAVRNAAISATNFAQPPPGAPGWTYTGSAKMSGGTLMLTTATNSEHGAAFFGGAVPSAGLSASFTATIGGGSGADGETFTMLDASKAGPGSIGVAGSGLGFAGLPGVAVTLDTYKGSGDPSSNFVGIASSTAGGAMTYIATATNVPKLRATNTVRVTVSSAGVVTVWINGTQVLTATAPVPATVLTGFTGSTGGLNDNHEVSNVVVSP